MRFGFISTLLRMVVSMINIRAENCRKDTGTILLHSRRTMASKWIEEQVDNVDGNFICEISKHRNELEELRRRRHARG